jgi:hypothetical protein
MKRAILGFAAVAGFSAMALMAPAQQVVSLDNYPNGGAADLSSGGAQAAVVTGAVAASAASSVAVSVASPVVGAAASHGVTAHLGGLPILGHEIRGLPVVGRSLAGPPPMWVVGAVAVDTYYLPKFVPGGCTLSSKFTMTDFNSPPRLQYYRNYLAPMPYTHPVVYKQASLPLQGSPEAVMPERVRQWIGATVSVEN